MKLGGVPRPQEDPVTVGRGQWAAFAVVHRWRTQLVGGSTFLSLRTSTALSQLQLAVKNHGAPEVDLSQAQQALF